MTDEIRLDERASGPEFRKEQEVVVWAHTDGTLRTTAEDGTETTLGAGGSFNGGTVTGAVTVDTGADEVQLSIDGSANENTSAVEVTARSGDPGIGLSIFPDGAGISMGGGSNAQVSNSVFTDGLGTDIATVVVANGAANQQVTLTGGVGSNLAEFVAGGNTTLKVNPNGYLLVAINTAPADGDLAANQCALWFDATNGSAKLMFKAKQADGTVKTGSVNVQT